MYAKRINFTRSSSALYITNVKHDIYLSCITCAIYRAHPPRIFEEEYHEHDNHPDAKASLREPSNSHAHSRNYRYGCDGRYRPDDDDLVCRRVRDVFVDVVQTCAIGGWNMHTLGIWVMID